MTGIKDYTNPLVGTSPETKATYDRVITFLKREKFRAYSKGWFKGYIVIPSEFGYYGKTIKVVNPRIKSRAYYTTYDIRSAYPHKLTVGHNDTDM